MVLCYFLGFPDVHPPPSLVMPQLQFYKRTAGRVLQSIEQLSLEESQGAAAAPSAASVSEQYDRALRTARAKERSRRSKVKADFLTDD